MHAACGRTAAGEPEQTCRTKVVGYVKKLRFTGP